MFTWFKKYSAFIALFILSVVLVLWPYITIFFPWIAPIQFLGIIVAIIFGLIIYFDRKLTLLERIAFGNVTLSHHSLTEAIQFSVAKKFKHKTIRIFAYSTGKILPLLTMRDIEVEYCQILVRSPDNIQNGERRLNLHNKQTSLIREWCDIQSTGKIRKLRICSYDFEPTSYFIIFDDKIIVIGLFHFDTNKVTFVEVGDPYVINNSQIPGSILIKKYINWFDNLAKDCKDLISNKDVEI